MEFIKFLIVYFLVDSNETIYMKKKLITYVLLFFITSCQIPEAIEVKEPLRSTEKRFVLNGDYKIIDKKLYADASGKNLPFEMDNIKKIWMYIDGSLLSHVIILKEDSIFVADNQIAAQKGDFRDKCKYRVANDSIFMEGQNANDPSIDFSIFIGVQGDALKSIEICKRYYYYLKLDKDVMLKRYGNWYGFESYDNVFYEGGWFSSPSELQKGDTIAWCNVKYSYHLISKDGNQNKWRKKSQ